MVYKALRSVLIGILLVYVLLGLYLAIVQKSFLYFPSHQEFDACEGFSDYTKLNIEGTRAYFKEQNTSSLVVHYHGNAGSACDRSAHKEWFEQSGKSVLFVEYTGYSNAELNPSKKRIVQDVHQVVSFIEQHDFEHVTVYGKSLGSGPASYHASIGHVDLLVLVTPFDSLLKRAQEQYPMYPLRFMFTENFDNSAMLNAFENNVIIIAGENDKVISPSHAQSLFDSLQTDQKEYILIEGYGHNDIWYSAQFTNELSVALS